MAHSSRYIRKSLPVAEFCLVHRTEVLCLCLLHCPVRSSSNCKNKAWHARWRGALSDSTLQLLWCISWAGHHKWCDHLSCIISDAGAWGSYLPSQDEYELTFPLFQRTLEVCISTQSIIICIIIIHSTTAWWALAAVGVCVCWLHGAFSSSVSILHKRCPHKYILCWWGATSVPVVVRARMGRGMGQDWFVLLCGVGHLLRACWLWECRHGACKALIWAVSGLHAQCHLGGMHCAVHQTPAKDNSKSNGNAVTMKQHKAELYHCSSPSHLPSQIFPFHFFQGGEIFTLFSKWPPHPLPAALAGD